MNKNTELNIKNNKTWEEIKFNWILLFGTSLLIIYIITQKGWL